MSLRSYPIYPEEEQPFNRVSETAHSVYIIKGEIEENYCDAQSARTLKVCAAVQSEVRSYSLEIPEDLSIPDVASRSGNKVVLVAARYFSKQECDGVVCILLDVASDRVYKSSKSLEAVTKLHPPPHVPHVGNR